MLKKNSGKSGAARIAGKNGEFKHV